MLTFLTLCATPAVQTAVLLFADPQWTRGGCTARRANRSAGTVRGSLQVKGMRVAGDGGMCLAEATDASWHRRPAGSGLGQRMGVLEPLHVELQ